MKKSTFIGNLAVWVVAAAACCAFLAWWNLGNGTPDISDPLVQLGVVLAAPVLLYAIGAVVGLVLLWFKKILVGRVTKRVCRAIGILMLLFVLLAGTPALLPDAGEALLGPAVVVVYVTMVAPLLIMMLGFVYAIGCAGVDTSKRGPFAKYLPDDHFDE
ncbi:MAG TPA: hypothetical protein IAA22_02960 [Candidatus Olsenella stercoravium]|uniref:Uncharacterized protein n=1 Tax=Candidatus Olsenella stercoravium TaxID=2838713 RepID=A0A9D2INY0_9ACTN|nr:hypothetical protein [Candidatus Olsenella stercoravium]